MQLIVYNDRVLPKDDDRQGRRPDTGFLQTVSGTKLCSTLEQNRESFVLERGVRDEKDDRPEALLQAEEAMVPGLAAASGDLVEGGLQARVCGLGISEGGRLVGPLPGLFKLEGAAGGASLSAYERVPKGGRGRGLKNSTLRL